jgi:hypothetical protein
VRPTTVQTAVQPSIKVSAMLNIPSMDEQKLAYRSLNTSEKTEAWKYHLNQISKSGFFSKEQNDLLIELQNYVTSDFFGKTETQHAASDYEQNFINRAQKLFSPNEFKKVFASLSTPLMSSVIPYLQQPPSNCECSQTSDYCATGTKCFAYQCKAGTGCGFLWNYTCNGDCLVPLN